MATQHPFATTLLRVTGLLAIACICVAATSTSSADDSINFPYQALVAKKEAMVRSGPGQVHYGTQKLSPGDVVEVYRHDPGGWCAIRPTKTSFCIIPESTVEIIDEGIGKITVDGTTPFVGTELGSVSKPLWQVKLREDENVAVLGQLSWPNPEGHSTIWYQIKPPAGEFRWIHISDIQSLDQPNIARSRPTPKLADPHQNASLANSPKPIATALPPVDSATQTRMASVVSPQTNRTTNSISQPNNFNGITFYSGTHQPPAGYVTSFVRSDRNVQPASYAAPAEQVQSPSPIQDTGSGWRKATRPIPSGRNFANSNNFANGRSSSSSNSPTFTNAEPTYGSSTNRFPNQSAQRSYPAKIQIADASSNRRQFAEQLSVARQFGSVSLTANSGQTANVDVVQSLNNRLTMEMLKEPATWDLLPIEAAARQFLLTATPVQRMQGQQFLVKLANCQKIADGYSSPNQPANFLGGSPASNRPVNLNSNQLSTTSGFSNPNANQSASAESQFDASGWLNELKQANGTSPSTYVLQDATGKIIFHVTPIPGLNINRYMKKKVGIKGQRGFNRRLKLNHVTAERVFAL